MPERQQPIKPVDLAQEPLASIESARMIITSNLRLGLSLREQHHRMAYTDLPERLKAAAGDQAARLAVISEVMSHNKKLALVAAALGTLINFGEAMQSQIDGLEQPYIDAYLSQQRMIAQIDNALRDTSYPTEARPSLEVAKRLLQQEQDEDPVLIRGRALVDKRAEKSENTPGEAHETNQTRREQAKTMEPEYDERVTILTTALTLMHASQDEQQAGWVEQVIDPILNSKRRKDKSVPSADIALPLSVKVKKALSLLTTRTSARYPSKMEKLTQAAGKEQKTEQEAKFYQLLAKHEGKGIIQGQDDTTRMVAFEQAFAQWISNLLTQAEQQTSTSNSDNDIADAIEAAHADLTVAAQPLTAVDLTSQPAVDFPNDQSGTQSPEDTTSITPALDPLVDFFAGLPDESANEVENDEARALKEKKARRERRIRGTIQGAIDEVLRHVFAGREPEQALANMTATVQAVASKIQGMSHTLIVAMSRQGIIPQLNRNGTSISNVQLSASQIIALVAFRRLDQGRGMSKADIKQFPDLVAQIITNRIAELQKN